MNVQLTEVTAGTALEFVRAMLEPHGTVVDE